MFESNVGDHALPFVEKNVAGAAIDRHDDRIDGVQHSNLRFESVLGKDFFCCRSTRAAIFRQ